MLQAFSKRWLHGNSHTGALETQITESAKSCCRHFSRSINLQIHTGPWHMAHVNVVWEWSVLENIHGTCRNPIYAQV